jgi:hypothetical protein
MGHAHPGDFVSVRSHGNKQETLSRQLRLWSDANFLPPGNDI